MKRFTKSLIALALLFAGTMGANAKTLDVNLSNLPANSENTTWAWDAGTSTGTFAWSNTSWNSTELFPLGNYSSYTTLNLETTAGTADHFRIILKFTNGTGQVTITPVAAGIVSVNLLDYMRVEDLAHVQTIRLSGANDVTGDVSVSNIYLEGPDINYIEEKTIQVTPTGTVDLNGITGTGAAWNILYPITCSDGTLFGSHTIDGDAQSANIEDYDYLLFAVSEASVDAKINLRVFVSSAETSDNSTRVILYPHPIADYASVENWTAETTITEPGIYVVNISDYPFLRGIKNRAYWQGDAGSIKISLAYVGSGSPVAPVDEVIRVGEEALADASVTCIDVTKLEATGITYDAANPNCLFIANAGQLTNTKNVIVDGVCANLELTDEKPFNAPVAFTATEAKFTKTMNADYGTMVIPFDAELPSDVEAFNITGNEGDVLTTAEAEAIEANKPVMLKGSGEVSFTASNAEIDATAKGVQTSGLLSGVYAATAVPTENTYVLQKQGEDVNFYKAISGLTVNPFRAYLTAAAGAARLTFDFNEATGIKTVKTTDGAEVYNLQGVRVANPTKGLYIVNGKKVIK